MKFTPAPDYPLPLRNDGVIRLPIPPPTDRWVPDLLGAPFQARTLRLPPDAEGEVFATLTRGNVLPQARGIVLAIHGWSDYFMQPHLAQLWESEGFTFYALDLRKCGRSMRHHHTPRYIADLSEYFADIAAAIGQIRSEHGPDLPITIWAHSQGGLTATLWAHQNRSQISGLVLNGPWLEWYGGAWLRWLYYPVVRGVATAFPHLNMRGIAPTAYDRTLDQRAGGAWQFVSSWRPIQSRRLHIAWMEAVLAGQAALAKVRDLPFPILMLSSESSTFLAPPTRAGAGDAVIDVYSSRKRAKKLGPQVEIHKIRGAWHDATLSPGPIRAQVEAAVRNWINQVLNG